jgi:hypothetical protein
MPDSKPRCRVPGNNDTSFYYFTRKNFLINQIDLKDSVVADRAGCRWGEDERFVLGECFED